MKPVRVFVNGIAARQGGGVTYLNQLLGRLDARDGVEFTVFGFSRVDAELRNRPGVRVVDLHLVHRNMLARLLVEKLWFPLLLVLGRYDVAFFPNGMITGFVPGRVRTVTMFRNMLPFSRRDLAKFGWGYARLRYWLLRRAYLASYRRADCVIFISRFAQEVIRGFVPDIHARSVVIPHGIAEEFRAEAARPGGEGLLYVSILNQYKHQIEIVRGLGLYKQRHGHAPRLTLVGFVKENYRRQLMQAVEAGGVREEVEFLGPVAYRELPAYYRGAAWIVFGSTCENCPNILLEGMGSGKPVICSSHEPMPEFLGEAGVYFDPEKPRAFADALERAMALSEAEALDLARHSLERSAGFRWDDTARRTFETLRAAGSGTRRQPGNAATDPSTSTDPDSR